LLTQRTAIRQQLWQDAVHWEKYFLLEEQSRQEQLRHEIMLQAYKKIMLAMTFKLAESGKAEAQFWLGNRYAYGKDRNSEYAIYWMTKAAEQNYKTDSECSQKILGMWYADGWGIPKDANKAIYWLTKAAEQGNPLTQSLLARLYAKGDCIPTDYNKAIYWMSKAAEQGHARSQYELGVWYAFGLLLQDSDKAIYWMTKAADQETWYQWKLGEHYANGNYIPQDFVKADYWLRKSCETNAKKYLNSVSFNLKVKLAKLGFKK
jgi:hypothetical protein